jgi:hypothetical protein
MYARAALALFLIAAPAAAKAKHDKDKAESDPAYAAIDRAEDICTADGAFGRPFSHQFDGHIDTTADDEWAPFVRLTISYREIRAVADFRGSGDSQSDDEAAARKFLKAFEKAEHHFAHHSGHSNGSEYHSSDKPESGYSFYLRQDGERILARCLSNDR